MNVATRKRGKPHRCVAAGLYLVEVVPPGLALPTDYEAELMGAGQRLHFQKELDHAVASILLLHASHSYGRCGDRLLHFSDERHVGARLQRPGERVEPVQGLRVVDLGRPPAGEQPLAPGFQLACARSRPDTSPGNSERGGAP